MSDIDPRITLHPLTDMSDGDRARISWFRARHLLGPAGGKQVWALEALTPGSDMPVAFAVFPFTGPFHSAGADAATSVMRDAGFLPAGVWQIGPDLTVWHLDILQPLDHLDAKAVPFTKETS